METNILNVDRIIKWNKLPEVQCQQKGCKEISYTILRTMVDKVCYVARFCDYHTYVHSALKNRGECTIVWFVDRSKPDNG